MSNATVTAAADRLARILETAPRRLADLSGDQAARPDAPGRWSQKQIVGHLIDSAGNNLQRIVRARIQGSLEFPSYEQESWVRIQSYATESWPDLVNLWLLLNRHLLHVIRAIPLSDLSLGCAIGGKDPIPLSAIIHGYVDHLEHHLASIIGGTP